MTILLVDVCDTLYAGNTTFDFFAHHFKDDARFQVLSSRRQSLANRILSKFSSGPDLIRAQAIELLAGESKSTLLEAGRAYAKSSAVIEPTHAYLQAARARGSKIYLVSSSLDFIVEAISNEIQVDGWFASELGFRGSECTGILKRDLTASKDLVIRSEFAGESDIEFISDNFSDANCIELVKVFTPVFKAHDLRARMFWLAKRTGRPLTYG